MSGYSGADVVAELSAEQWGIVTTGQARRAGVSAQQIKRLTDRGILDRLHYGIYRMTRLPHDQHLPVRVAWIALDPETPAWHRLEQDLPTGVVSHRSAAVLHGLGDIDADVVELTAVRRIRLSLPDLRIHTAALDRRDWVVVDGIPTTTAVRTIDDLAAAHIDSGHLAGVVRDAVEHGLASIGEVQQVLRPHAFSYEHALNDGKGFLRALIAEAGVSQDLVELAGMSTGDALFKDRQTVTDNNIRPRTGTDAFARLSGVVTDDSVSAVRSFIDSFDPQFDSSKLAEAMFRTSAVHQMSEKLAASLTDQPGVRDALRRISEDLYNSSAVKDITAALITGGAGSDAVAQAFRVSRNTAAPPNDATDEDSE
ncbi:type IV toxin-antitoxin system AbiEi family antitoxin domain-containing protein [Antrihabitans spumae]|uniref:Type IV toxin-antitoxin system AbiEi family antitoxin domain-containing protein n=1 Tax=Antrihabitans spumae TaxID=3373370 RepID=A0ABW7KH12_9NOCA